VIQRAVENGREGDWKYSLELTLSRQAQDGMQLAIAKESGSTHLYIDLDGLARSRLCLHLYEGC
jgi:hypothetical protein